MARNKDRVTEKDGYFFLEVGKLSDLQDLYYALEAAMIDYKEVPGPVCMRQYEAELLFDLKEDIYEMMTISPE